MQDGSQLDPRKNVHLRPGNNPFSIFSAGVAASDEVPDIFADTPAATPQRKAAAPVLVPTLRAEEGFSLLPPTPPSSATVVKSAMHQQTPSGKGAAAMALPASLKAAPPVVAPAAVLMGQPPPPPPPALVSAVDDDSFFDEDDDVPHPPLPRPVAGAGVSGSGGQDALLLAAEKRRAAELELRLAQSNMELLAVRERLRGKDDELAQLQSTLAQAKRKEREDNRALEAALGAIEAKLEAAVARANAAEAEAGALRARVQQLEVLAGSHAAAGSEAARLREANKSLRRVVKQAANMSLDFGEAANKSADGIRALIAHTNTLQRLGALLSSLEKVVIVDEGDE